MRVAYFFNNLFLLHPWIERALVFSLLFGAALFAFQRLTSAGDARAFWHKVGKHPLTWIFVGSSLLGAFSVPIPGSYYLNCGGSADAPELQAAITNNASGRFNMMYVPSGVCLIGSTITLTQANSGLTILGVSANNSIIRQAPGANLTYMFFGNLTAGNTLTKFTVRDVTIDENYPNNTSVASAEMFAFGGGGNYTFHLFDNVNLLNCIKSCINYQTTGTVSNLTLRDSVFNTSQCADFIAYDAVYVLITGNSFNSYDQGGSTSFCAAVVSPESNGTANSNWTVSNNIAYPNGSIEFFFETDPQTGVTPQSMQVIHNNCNALGGNGCGVSMVGDHSIVGYNTVINAAYGDRSGCECSGSDFMIIGNNYYNGQISITDNSNAYPLAYFNATASASTSLTVNSTSYGTVTAGQFVFGPGFPVGTYIVSYSGGVATLNNAVTVTAQNLTAGGPNGILVLDNIIGLHGGPTSNGVSAIVAAGVNHLDIRNNLITINFTNTTNSYPAIYVGFYGGAGPVNYAVLEGNHVIDLSSTSSMIGIKVNDSSTTPDNYVAVRRNVIEGFNTGLFFDSDAYSTYINACSNDLRTTTTTISGAPTGTGSSVSNAVCTVSF